MMKKGSGLLSTEQDALQKQIDDLQTTPGKLVVMLYDGALRFLHLALDALKRATLRRKA